eukprot:6492085-Amphidinium_carterae.1
MQSQLEVSDARVIVNLRPGPNKSAPPASKSSVSFSSKGFPELSLDQLGRCRGVRASRSPTHTIAQRREVAMVLQVLGVRLHLTQVNLIPMFRPDADHLLLGMKNVKMNGCDVLRIVVDCVPDLMTSHGPNLAALRGGDVSMVIADLDESLPISRMSLNDVLLLNVLVRFDLGEDDLQVRLGSNGGTQGLPEVTIEYFSRSRRSKSGVPPNDGSQPIERVQAVGDDV